MTSLPHSLQHLKINKSQVMAEYCRRSLYEFVKEFWEIIISDPYVDNWHIKYLCDEIQYAFKLVFNREHCEHDLIANVPPGASKSTIFTVAAPAWAWANDPTLTIITGSYSNDLSTTHAVKSRDIIKSEKYRRYYPKIKIRPDVDNKTNYANTLGGQRISTSVGGTITGKHAHIIIIDDPLNPMQAASDTERETANKWITETLPTRKVDKDVSLTCMVMQRLHVNDCTGHLLSIDGDRIKHICLPARESDNIRPADARTHYIDGLLDPKRLSDATLTVLEKRLGSYGAAGQLGQRPTPVEGAIWQKWFIPVPDNVFPRPDQLKSYATDWDTAMDSKSTNDYNAFCTSGYTQDETGRKIYIDRVGWKRAQFPELIKMMQMRPAPHYIEAKASGKSAKQTLVRQGIAAIEVQVEGGDKIARTQMASPTVEAGLVYVRQSILDSIYNDSEQGLLNFPNGAHDDLNDCIVQAIQRHSKTKTWW